MRNSLFLKNFFKLLIWDIRFQWKHGFYLVYGVVSLLYAVLLRMLPNREFYAALLIFTDTTVIGCLFIGAIILLEKDQGTNGPFSVLPVRFVTYVLAKICSLLLITLLSTACIIFFGGVKIGMVWTTVFGLVVTTLIYSGLGLRAALQSRGLTGYFFRIIPFITLGMMPIFDFLPLYDRNIFFWLPTSFSLRFLTFGHTGPLPVLQVLGTFYLLAVLGIVVFLSVKSEPAFLSWEKK